jgi:hypothetical protein
MSQRRHRRNFRGCPLYSLNRTSRIYEYTPCVLERIQTDPLAGIDRFGRRLHVFLLLLAALDRLVSGNYPMAWVGLFASHHTIQNEDEFHRLPRLCRCLDFGLKCPPYRRLRYAIDLSQLSHRLTLRIAIGRDPNHFLVQLALAAERDALARLARSIPSSQRLRIRPRSNSLIPPIIVSIRRPTSEVVSHQLSPSDTKPQERS